MTVPNADMLSDDDRDKLKSSDYVYDATFGVVAKDVPTLLRLRREERKAEAKEAPQSAETPAALDKLAKKAN